jgi:DNA-binding transcriptional LysR family regulator
MDTRGLTCFLAVAGEGNLTRAAKALFLSQSAVSSQVRLLEEELGFPLFKRLARGMELTAEGEALLPPARRAVRGMEDFAAQAAALREAPGRVLAVGLNTDPSFLRMSALVQGMRRLAPGVRLSFRVSESRLTAGMLRQGEMDAGFRFGVWGEEGVHDEFLAPVTLGIAVPTALAGRVRPGDWRGLAALPWIATFRGCPFHVAVRERLSALGAEINAVEQTMDENIMRELVSEGVGVAVLRLGEARMLAEAGRAALWPETLQVPLCLSYPAGQGYLSPLREFREVVHAVWAEPVPAPRLDSPGPDG